MNPTTNDYQNVLINRSSNKADISILAESYEEYLINKYTASKIISDVVNTVKEWKYLATKFGMANREMDVFGKKIEARISYWDIL